MKKFIGRWVTAASWLAIAWEPALASESRLSLPTLRQKLADAGARWHAAETSVSRRTRAEWRQMLGVPESPESATFAVDEPAPAERRAAEVFDWRNRAGVNWVGPVLNQGICGSCVAFSTVATLETQMNITSGIPGLHPSYSTQALFVCGGGACQFGWFPHLAAQHLKKTGVPDEACAPYTMGATGETVACSSVCKDAASRSVKLVDFTAPTKGTKDIEAVKRALKQGPVVTTLQVYEDFMLYAGGVYRHVAGDFLGGHAVSIVGYDETERAWIIRNSWGTSWGEQGFGKVSWDDTSGVGVSTWLYQVPTAEGYVRIEGLRDRDFISGPVKFGLESTYAGTKSVEVAITGTGGRFVEGAQCSPAPCQVVMDSATWSDGQYEAVAVAKLASGEARSQRRYFFVANGKPSLALSLRPKGFDAMKPVKDRIEFEVTADAKPVPMSSLALHVVQDGKEVYTRRSDTVTPRMILSWRTFTVPNGRYEVYLTGELRTQSASGTGNQVQVESTRVGIEVRN